MLWKQGLPLKDSQCPNMNLLPLLLAITESFPCDMKTFYRTRQLSYHICHPSQWLQGNYPHLHRHPFIMYHPLHHHLTIIPQQSPQILTNLVYFTSIWAIQLPFLMKICCWMTFVIHQVFLLVHNLLMAAGGLVLDILNQIYQLPESQTMFLHHFSTPPFSNL